MPLCGVAYNTDKFLNVIHIDDILQSQYIDKSEFETDKILTN